MIIPSRDIKLASIDKIPPDPQGKLHHSTNGLRETNFESSSSMVMCEVVCPASFCSSSALSYAVLVTSLVAACSCGLLTCLIEDAKWWRQARIKGGASTLTQIKFSLGHCRGCVFDDSALRSTEQPSHWICLSLSAEHRYLPSTSLLNAADYPMFMRGSLAAALWPQIRQKRRIPVRVICKSESGSVCHTLRLMLSRWPLTLQ